MHKKIILLLLLTLSIVSCSKDKEQADQVITKKTPSINASERARASVENEGGLQDAIFGNKKGTTFEFATSNILWRATLDSLSDMPILSANYSGGLLVTDWVGSETSFQSYKIQVIFKSSQLASSSIEVKTFIKKCNENLNSCKITTGSEKTNEDVKGKILAKARDLEVKNSQKK